VAERKLRSDLQGDASDVRVEVKAFPAVKLLFKHADRVTVELTDYRPSDDSGDDDASLAELMRQLSDQSTRLARQEVEPSAELWFISARDTAHTRAVEQEPRVSLTFSSRTAWVAVYGRATVVDDRDKLAELWNTFAEAWLPGGPDDPNAVLLRVDVDQGEYWDTVNNIKKSEKIQNNTREKGNK